MKTQTDYLIIGSGIAGLTLAIKLAERFPARSIIILTKASEDESNTRYAQGGIAIVLDDSTDSYEKHIEDTLICGDGLCNETVVRVVVTEAPKRFQELLQWGAQFDKDSRGKFDLGKEGGHSENRVIHHKDQTGAEIERAILEKAHSLKNIVIHDHYFAIDLLVAENICAGAVVLNRATNEIVIMQADYTILATGGIGQVYGHTTNPAIATGDGIAMAYRAEAKIKDMEFIQFHPTAFYDGKEGSAFLISEAVRGFGAILRDKNGKKFMLDYDQRGDLASRDIVSQSIHSELQKNRDECVYLDCSHLDMDGFRKHFPMIHDHCKNHGIDIAKDWIPVLPAQHYVCGGIAVDTDGKTSVSNLFACGECAYTGLHGANRLASNSLLEAIVFSEQIFQYLSLAQPASAQHKLNLFHWKNNDKPAISQLYLNELKKDVQSQLRLHAGIIRNDADLMVTAHSLYQWQIQTKELLNKYAPSVALYEFYNLLLIAHLIVSHSLLRTENRGGFLKTTIDS